MRQRGRVKLALSIAVVGLFGVMGATTTAGAPLGSEPTSYGATANEAQDTASCISATRKSVSQAKKHLPVARPPSPVNMSELRGKTLWVISIVNTPWVQEGVSGFNAAAKAIGAKAKFFDGKGNITLVNQGIATAIAQRAAGIVIWAIDPRNVSGQLARAKAAGIPVVAANSVTVFPGKLPKQEGVFGHVGSDYAQTGRWFADYMLAQTQCKLDAVIFSIKTLPFFVTAQKAAEARIARMCPSCQARVEFVDLATLATSLGRQVQTALNRDPDVNFIATPADVLAQVMEPAIVQTGKRVPMISHDGAGPTLKTIRSDGLSVATVSTPDPPLWGWAFVDQLGRANAGQRPVVWSLPNRLIDKSNIGKSNAELFPAYKKLDVVFKRAWGVR